MRPLLVFLSLLLASPAFADEDHDRAREALARGDILPLTRILAVIERELVGGRVIDIDFDHDNNRYVYEVEAVSRDGRLVELSIDASTGAVLDRDDGDD
jgi:uncharacterized membrane protein YkoI